MAESPFATYRAILVDGDYSAAGFLQSFAMAMYAGGAFPMDASGLRNLDDQHMRAFQEMAAWFRRHGEGDPDFVDVCQAIKANRRAYAQRIKAQLDEVLASDPDQYEGGRSEHAESARFYRREHEKNLEGEPAEFGKNRTPRQSPNSAKCWISSRGCRIICDMQR